MKKIMFILLFGGIVSSLIAQEIQISFDWSIKPLIVYDYDTIKNKPLQVELATIYHQYSGVFDLPVPLIPLSKEEKEDYLSQVVTYDWLKKFFDQDTVTNIFVASEFSKLFPNEKRVTAYYTLYVRDEKMFSASYSLGINKGHLVYASDEGTFVDYPFLERNGRKIEFMDESIIEYSEKNTMFLVNFAGKSLYCYAYKQYKPGFVGFLTKTGWDIYTEDGKILVMGAVDFYYSYKGNYRDYPIPKFSDVTFLSTASDVSVTETYDGIVLYVYKYPDSYEYIYRYSVDGEELKPIDNRLKE